MKHVDTSHKELARIETLIVNLTRSVDILNVDIESEEERTRVKDTFAPSYPILARQLRTRRDNLTTTINALQEFLHKDGARGSNYSESLTA
jgi:hypothetical protein